MSQCKMRRKAWTIAGPEFCEKARMKTLIKKDLCGLKMSGQTFWELLADVLREMGFTLTRHDANVWIKPREDGCNFIATHVDDFIVVAKDSKKCADQIKKTFNLRLESKINYFLVHEIRRKKNGLWATSAEKIIHEGHR